MCKSEYTKVFYNLTDASFSSLHAHPSTLVSYFRADDLLHVGPHTLLQLWQDHHHAPLVAMKGHLASEHIYWQHGAPSQVSASPSRDRGKKVFIQDARKCGAGCVLCHILENPRPASEEYGKSVEELISSMTQGRCAGCRGRTHSAIWPTGSYVVYVIMGHEKSLSYQRVRTVQTFSCFWCFWLTHGGFKTPNYSPKTCAINSSRCQTHQSKQPFSTAVFVAFDAQDKIIPVIMEEKYAHLRNTSNYNSPQRKQQITVNTDVRQRGNTCRATVWLSLPVPPLAKYRSSAAKWHWSSTSVMAARTKVSSHKTKDKHPTKEFSVSQRSLWTSISNKEIRRILSKSGKQHCSMSGIFRKIFLAL